MFRSQLKRGSFMSSMRIVCAGPEPLTPEGSGAVGPL